MNAISERSFSALKLLKTDTRSTIHDNGMNHLMILHIHKERTDAIDGVEVAKEFAGSNDRRKNNFGKFRILVAICIL